MRLNNIIKFNLETRTKELKDQGKTLDEISEILSVESKQKITKSTVFRYFEAKDREAVQVIEKQDKLKAKVVEAEISTIQGRLNVIDKLLEVFEKCETKHEFQIISKEIREHYDSLDKRLGKISLGTGPTINLNNINLNNAKELPDAELIRIIEHDQEE